MEQLNKNIHFRITENEKNKIDMVLTDINKNSNDKKGYRFLIMEFVNNYLENNSIGLEYQKQQLLKEIQEQENEKNKLISSIQENEIKIKAIDNELNNKSVNDISNFKYKDNINHAFNRLKEIVLENKINSIELIENDIIQLERTFKIKEKGILKKIVSNHFQEWQKEILLNSDPEQETTNEQEIINISEKMKNKFIKPQQRIKNLNDYLNEETTRIMINKYISNSKKDITEQEIINYMLENEDKIHKAKTRSI